MSLQEKLSDIKVRRLEAGDLAQADRIMRLAFGTFLGVANPVEFMGDADFIRTRWEADPSLALAAEVDGTVVGTNFVTCWGSVGFFGPLTVDPSLWNRGVARALLDQTIPLFDERDVKYRGLFTFGHSPKHISLYQRYGFLPRFLTAVLSKSVSEITTRWKTFSEMADQEKGRADAARVTGSILEGFDVQREIDAVLIQGLGDTVLVYDVDELVAFAVCHVGPGTEAGSSTCFVKVGAAKAGNGAGEAFVRLLDACEGFAAKRGASRIVAGVNTGRRSAYRLLLDRGFCADMIGVTMHQPDDDAYHHADAFVIDDWR